MAAVLAPHPAPTTRRPALRLVPPPGRELRPVPRSITPPPRLRPSSATYWRRRVVALLVLTSLVVVAHFLASSAFAPPDELSVVTSSTASVGAVAPAAAPTVEPAGDVYVVRPGDTMWSIASSLQPDGDVRALVDQLTERAGGSGLQAGQRIPLDDLGG